AAWAAGATRFRPPKARPAESAALPSRRELRLNDMVELLWGWGIRGTEHAVLANGLTQRGAGGYGPPQKNLRRAIEAVLGITPRNHLRKSPQGTTKSRPSGRRPRHA